MNKTTNMMEPFFDRLTVGNCIVCKEGHSLVDGVCYTCRQPIKGQAILVVPPNYMKAIGDFDKHYHPACYKKETKHEN